MRETKFNRRDIIKGGDRAHRDHDVRRADPRPGARAAAITPALIEAAKKEGKLAFYTAMDLAFAQQLGKAFEAKYGIAVRVERSGAERIFQRIGQEYTPTSARSTWSTPPTPRIASFGPATAGSSRICRKRSPSISPRTTTIRTGSHHDAHPGVADRLQHQHGEEGGGAQELRRSARPEMGGQDGEGASRLQRHHHERDVPDRARLGWDYFEKLAKQRVMQVQSATDCPKKVQLGERAVMVDGAGYFIIRFKEEGSPVEIVYPTEGTPMAARPSVV